MCKPSNHWVWCALRGSRAHGADIRCTATESVDDTHRACLALHAVPVCGRLLLRLSAFGMMLLLVLRTTQRVQCRSKQFLQACMEALCVVTA